MYVLHKTKNHGLLIYSSDLRIGEICSLYYEDVNRRNMCLYITYSKSRNDRYAILSHAVLELLTRYWFECVRPKEYLLPKQNGQDRPINTFFLSMHIHTQTYFSIRLHNSFLNDIFKQFFIFHTHPSLLRQNLMLFKTKSN